MTREKAAEASRILDKLVEFESFMDEVLVLAHDVEMSSTTRENLNKVLNAELNQLNKRLEDL